MRSCLLRVLRGGNTCLPVFLCSLLTTGVSAAAQDATEARVVERDRERQVVIGPFADDLLAAIGRQLQRDSNRPAGISVSIELPDSDRRVALLGQWTLDSPWLRFEPRFPLKGGMSYRIFVDPSQFDPPIEGAPSSDWLVTVEDELSTPPASVVRVDPASDRVPENLLKFYVHFSAPVRQGSVYEHVRLLDEGGREIEMPFVDVGRELWDRSGKRVTLIIDPGRIKEGLRPREELGPILQAGHDVTLLILPSWRDALGRPIAQEYRRTFQVGPPDKQMPNFRAWSIKAPAASTTDPVVVRFDEPLDFAMLQRVLDIIDDQGNQIRGTSKTLEQETVWQFQPEVAWQPGVYRLQVDPNLEDLAGNSLAKPFEVDLFDRVEPARPTRPIRLPFEVEASR